MAFPAVLAWLDAGCGVSRALREGEGTWGDAGAKAQAEESGGCYSLTPFRFWPCERPAVLPRLRNCLAMSRLTRSQHSLN